MNIPIANSKTRLYSNLSITYLSGNIFVFLCTIPWFGLRFLDSQPWPIIGGMLFLSICIYDRRRNLNIPKVYILILWLMLIGIILGIIYSTVTNTFQNNFLVYRGFANYMGIFIMLIAFYEYLKRYGFPLEILIFSNVIWIIVGIIQLFIPDVVSAFVALRTTVGRGITSLAPEPTFFALYLFFTTWLTSIGVNYRPSNKLKWLFACNTFAILFLAKSTMVALFLVVTGFIWVLSKFNLFKIWNSFKLFMVTLLIIIGVYYTINYLIPDTRIAKLSNLLISVDVWQLIAMDRSVSQRVGAIFLPISGTFYNYLFPGGFHSFSSVSGELIIIFDNLFTASRSKIMSWIGSFVYELGVFGILALFLFVGSALNGSRKRRYEVLLLFILLFSAIPLAFPLVPMILATFYFYNSKKKMQKYYTYSPK